MSQEWKGVSLECWLPLFSIILIHCKFTEWLCSQPALKIPEHVVAAPELVYHLSLHRSLGAGLGSSRRPGSACFGRIS